MVVRQNKITRKEAQRQQKMTDSKQFLKELTKAIFISFQDNLFELARQQKEEHNK